MSSSSSSSSSHTFHRIFAACLLPLTLAACAQSESDSATAAAGGAEQTGVAQSALSLDYCASASADVTISPSSYTLTHGQNSKVSSTAAYAYGGGCDRFIVDAYVGPDVSPLSGVVFRGAAYDLPSSSAIGGELPNNALDCSKLKVYVSFYGKKASESSHTLYVGSANGGVWKTTNGGGGYCELEPLPNTGLPEYVAKPPADGTITTYRIAVKVMLRGVAQQASVHYDPYYPPPR